MRTRTLLCVLLILSCLAPFARADRVAGLPLHVQELGEGVIRLWIGDHISSTAVTAFATDDGIVVVDTFGSPEIDRGLRAAIAKRLGRDDFTTLINTHEHADHVGGNAVYADCTIVGHELVAAGINQRCGRNAQIETWLVEDIERIEAELADLDDDAPGAGRLREDLILQRLELETVRSGAVPPAPTTTFSDRLTLKRGDLTFELYHIGGLHTASDIAILVPERGLLLTGDTMADVWLTETGGCLAAFRARPNVTRDMGRLLHNWNALLARADEIDRYLPGHWNAELSAQGFEERVDYMEAVWADVQSGVAAGDDLMEVLARNVLSTRFPELAEARGFSQQNNYTTVCALWSDLTGMRSAARELHRLHVENGTPSDIRNVLAQRGHADREFFFLENEFNSIGYYYLREGQTDRAVAFFRYNTEFFPESWNSWDSLGEGLLAAGERDEAIAMYEKSLELNPESENGRAALARIRGEAVPN